MNSIYRLKYAEPKFFCNCKDVYKQYEGDDYDKIYDALFTLKNKKSKINNILIEKYGDMLVNIDIEQNFYSITAIGTFKIGHDSIRLMKWLVYYDHSYYEKLNYYELMGSA